MPAFQVEMDYLNFMDEVENYCHPSRTNWSSFTMQGSGILLSLLNEQNVYHNYFWGVSMFAEDVDISSHQVLSCNFRITALHCTTQGGNINKKNHSHLDAFMMNHFRSQT